MPPNYLVSSLGFPNPEERLQVMDEQKLDQAMMWPMLAGLLEACSVRLYTPANSAHASPA